MPVHALAFDGTEEGGSGEKAEDAGGSKDDETGHEGHHETEGHAKESPAAKAGHHGDGEEETESHVGDSPTAEAGHHGGGEAENEHHHGDGSAEEEHHHGGHHGHHGRHVVTMNEFQMAVSLLCIVVTLITLFYFVLNRDKDIRFYSWDMLSKGITIFLAVSVFTGLNLFLNKRLKPAWFCYGAQVFVCLFALQLVLWFATWMKDIVACKAFGGLVGHMTAFAWIRLWSHLQEELHESVLGKLVYLIVPLAFVTKLLTIYAGVVARKTCANCDGIIDDQEQDWIDKSTHVEEEAGALLVGFLLTQTVRYLISGEHIEEFHVAHTIVEPRVPQAILLLAFGILAQAVSFYLTCSCNTHAEPGGAHGHQDNFLSHISFAMLTHVLSFSFGWCFIFFLDWLIGPCLPTKPMLSRLMVSMVCTYTSLSLVFFMDKIADKLGRGQAQLATRGIIGSVGMMVGFSWERCFDHAVEAMCSWVAVNKFDGRYEHAMAMITGIVIMCFTMPAMYWYVIPITDSAQKDQKEELFVLTFKKLMYQSMDQKQFKFELKEQLHELQAQSCPALPHQSHGETGTKTKIGVRAGCVIASVEGPARLREQIQRAEQAGKIRVWNSEGKISTEKHGIQEEGCFELIFEELKCARLGHKEFEDLLRAALGRAGATKEDLEKTKVTSGGCAVARVRGNNELKALVAETQTKIRVANCFAELKKSPEQRTSVVDTDDESDVGDDEEGGLCVGDDEEQKLCH